MAPLLSLIVKYFFEWDPIKAQNNLTKHSARKPDSKEKKQYDFHKENAANFFARMQATIYQFI